LGFTGWDRCRTGSLELEVKRVLVVALVVVVLVTGIPVVMAMPTANCVDCDLAVMVASSCILGVLAAAVGVALVLVALRLRTRTPVLVSLLATSGLDRPPRLA
jgi:hypothetical protein